MAKTKAKRKIPVKRKSLLDTTIYLLKHRDHSLTLEDVAEKTDCKASFLATLTSSNPPHRPGVNSIQRLYEFLSGQQLNY